MVARCAALRVRDRSAIQYVCEDFTIENDYVNRLPDFPGKWSSQVSMGMPVEHNTPSHLLTADGDQEKEREREMVFTLEAVSNKEKLNVPLRERRV